MGVGAIAGVLNSRGTPDPAAIERMLQAVPHRGANPTTIQHGGAILGKVEGQWSSLGRQGPYLCALLGPLDNHSDLARLLGIESDDPAELVAAAFATWGETAAGRLRGAFAGIVTDGERGWAFRDHIGGRTLFYRRDGGTWWGASEAKQVLAGAGLRRQPDIEAVTRTYYRGTSPDSALKGVKRLMYGSVLVIEPSGLREFRHWDVDPSILESRRVGSEEAADELREILDRVIGLTVRESDSVALSGGIDSPMVAAFAAPTHRDRFAKPLAAHTFVYPEHATVDESRYTRLVADWLGMELAEVIPTASPLDNIEHWLYLADGPWDSTPMSIAAQGYAAAADQGATQVLTGTLAEYVFTINSFLLGHLASHGRWRALSDLLEVRRGAGRSRLSLAKQLARELTPAPIAKSYAALRRRRSNAFPTWVRPEAVTGRRYSTVLGDPVRRRWSRLTLGATRGTTTTSEAIEACAASLGVTVRHPLADIDVWEFFLSLPVEILYPDTTPKSFVRKAMRGLLPDEILDRRDKTVFDENVLDTVPWDTLISRLRSPDDVRIEGIDYELLAARLDGRRMEPAELVWAYDLTTVHTFLESF